MIANDEEIAKIKRESPNHDKELSNLSQVGIGLQGLSSAGSLNSIIQVLFHINIFKHYVFYLRESRVSNSYIALEFQKIFIQLIIKENPPPSIKQLLFKLKISFDELDKNNDPIIYFHRIYNILRNDNFFRDLFIGSVSKINRNALFLSLSLNVDLGDNIETIFDQMYSSLKFDRLPPVIFLNLERIQKNNVNHKFVSFPASFDLTKYAANELPANYELFSVIVHSGRDKNGHFFVYINDINLCEWILFDDSKVKIVSQDMAIKENFGGDENYYSARVLVYYDISLKDLIFEPDSNDYASSMITEKFSSENLKEKKIFSFLNNSKANKDYKVNVVQVRDIAKYAESESIIKFSSDKSITVFKNDTVKEIYSKMGHFLRASSEKLTIWVIFRSVLSLKILHKYDNEILSRMIEPILLQNIQFFVESEEEEEDEEYSNAEKNEKSRKGPTLFKKEESNKKKLVLSEKHENDENDENSILVFLFTYNCTKSQPLDFYGTVIIKFNEDILSLCEFARSNRCIKADTQMVAFQIIDQKCFLIPDPSKTVGSLELSDGSIIVIQPYLCNPKGSSRPKKPKSHSIFTYCPDYISLPQSFYIYYEYKKDPYILLLKYKDQKKMVQFPKSINCEDFKNFVLKSFNIDLNPESECILFYSKMSTKPIDFIPSVRVGEIINNIEIDENLSQLYLVKVLSNEVDDYYNMIRLKIKMKSSARKKGITEFLDKSMLMIDVVNELKKKYDDLSNYFILPLNSSKEIIPENFVIENIRNPIYFNLRLPNEIYITMILIVNGKEIKELDVHVIGDDTFLDFKNQLNILNTRDARFYTIGANGNQKSINDSQLMKKYGNNKTIIYFEAPFVPSLLDNMIVRPLSNTVNYNSQIFPKESGNPLSFSVKSKRNDDIKPKIQIEFANSITDNYDSNDSYLIESGCENDHLLIKDQFNSDEAIKIDEFEMKEKLKNSRQFKKMFPMNEDIHLFYTDNVVPSFNSDSQLEEIIFNKDVLLRHFYYQPLIRKNVPNSNGNNSTNVTTATTTDNDDQSESVQIEEKRGRGRPKKVEVIKSETEEEENNNNKNEGNNDNNESNNEKNSYENEIIETSESNQNKKMQVEEDTKIDEENYSKYIFDYKSDDDINYDENDDGDDDDDEAVNYEMNLEDDYEIDEDDRDDNYTSKKFKKSSRGRKRKKQNDDKNVSTNPYRTGLPIIPPNSIGNIFRNGNNNNFFARQPMNLSDPLQSQATIALRGNPQIPAHVHAQIPNPIPSYSTADNGRNVGIDENESMLTILKHGNHPLVNMHNKQNEIGNQPYNINNNSENAMNIDLGMHGEPKYTKISHPINQLPQVYPNQNRMEIITPIKHFQSISEIQKEHHQEQNQRKVLQINHLSELSQPNEIQQQSFKKQQTSVVNYPTLIKTSPPTLKNSQQQQQQQQSQSQQQQQAYQNSRFQAIKQTIQPHPQPQIRTQQQNKQQQSVQFFSYNKQLPEVQQHSFQSGISTNSENQKKNHSFHSGNPNKIDEIITINTIDELSEGRNKSKNDADSYQNRNVHSNVNKTKHIRIMDLNKGTEKILDTDNIGYIRDPSLNINPSGDSSLPRLLNDNEFFSDASSKLHFPRNPFIQNSFRLMPTHENEMISLNQGDDPNKKQRDLNNRNRLNDPFQNSKFSDFSLNDDNSYPL